MRVHAITPLGYPWRGGAETYIHHLLVLISREISLPCRVSSFSCDNVQVDGIIYQQVDPADIPAVIAPDDIILTQLAASSRVMATKHRLVVQIIHSEHDPRPVADDMMRVFNSPFVRDRCGAKASELVVYPPFVPHLITAKRRGGWVVFINPLAIKGAHLVQKLASSSKVPFTVVRTGWGSTYRQREVPIRGSNVRLLEPMDVRDLLQECSVLLLPSREESFGRIAVEARYNGIPVLVSQTVDALRLWGSDTGVIPLPPEDVSAWQSALLSVLKRGDIPPGESIRHLVEHNALPGELPGYKKLLARLLGGD